jgi:replicative DNA helicase
VVARRERRPISSDPELRVMPHSIDAERAVLGAVIISPTGWSLAASCVKADDFYRDAHRRIFVSMAQLSERGAIIDLVTLKDALARSGELEEVGGAAYMASLVDGVPRSTNVPHYAAIVREYSRKRQAILLASQLVADAYDGADSASEIIDSGISKLSGIIHESGFGLVTIRDAVSRYVSAVQSGDAGHVLPTGFVDLDTLISGFKPGDLVIVAARPSVGKSSLGLGFARNAAAIGQPAVFFTVEMTDEQLASRVLSWESGVSTAKLERQTATAEEYRIVQETANGIEAPLAIVSTATTVTEIGAWCRLAKQTTGLSLGVVDYIQLLVPEKDRARSEDSAQAQMAGISAGLKRIARELGMVIVAISQLNRAPEARKDKRPHTSDLRGSGALEQDCDIALLVFREEMYTPKPENVGTAEIIVAKNRTGPTGVVRLAFVNELAMFGNLARGF